jgi:hypothetical protein
VRFRKSQDNGKSSSQHSVAAIPPQISKSNKISLRKSLQMIKSSSKFGMGVCSRCPRAVFRSPGFVVEHVPPSPDVCPLKNTIILLSPCVVGMPYLTEDLLPAHGATFFPASELKRIIDAGSLGEGTRMLALVEDNRCEDIEEVVGVVGEHGERIKIYSWRLLEEVVKYEKGQKADLEWRVHLVCHA